MLCCAVLYCELAWSDVCRSLAIDAGRRESTALESVYVLDEEEEFARVMLAKVGLQAESRP